MEMQEIPPDKETEKEEEREDEEASKPMPEVKHEEEPDASYSPLQTPCEDVYYEALSIHKAAAAGKQSEGNIRRYRAACLFLLVTCIVFLLVIIVLALNVRAGAPACPVTEDTAADIETGGQNLPSAPTCSIEQCQVHFSDSFVHRIGCQQCSKGWLAFGRSCYYLSTIRMSWDESQKNCTARGGSLAVVGDRKVQSFLTAKGNLKYWIGLRNRGDAWTWVNNTMLRESFWEEPPHSGDCGILCSDSNANKNWIRASCQAQAYYICEVQL